MDGKQRRIKKSVRGTKDDGAGVRLAMTVICIIAVVMVTVYFIGAQINPALAPDGAGEGETTTGDDALWQAPTNELTEPDDTGADTDFKVYISFDNTPETSEAEVTQHEAEVTDSPVTSEEPLETDEGAAPVDPSEGDETMAPLPEDHIFLFDPFGKHHKHDIIPATCVTGAWCRICGSNIGIPAKGHDWQEATCTEPKTCAACGETEGEPLGHNWRAATCKSAKTCRRCGEQEGEVSSKHDWKDATCTKPKTCSVCGATDGEALGHKWRGATCTDPKTCKRCGKTSGKAAGHKWKDATTSSPKKCTVCGISKGDRLPNPIKVGKFSYTDDDYELLARLLYIEAGGESYNALHAVASVVMNRVRTSGNSIYNVIYAPGQFATGRINKVTPTDACYRAAKAVLNGDLYDRSIRYFRLADTKKWGSRTYCFEIDGIAFFS